MFICRYVYHILCDFISFCGAFFFIGNYALSPHLTAYENMTIFDFWNQLHLYCCGMPQVQRQQRKLIANYNEKCSKFEECKIIEIVSLFSYLYATVRIMTLN